MSKLSDKLTYFYIRNIKKYMICPSCGDKLLLDKKNEVWSCCKCSYSLSTEEFENDYIFWFCDGCGVFLNNQKGFDLNGSQWTCKKCGVENDISLNNVVDICRDCGEKLPPNTKFGLCDKCKIEELKLLGKQLELASDVLLNLSSVMGSSYAMAKGVHTSVPMEIDDFPICKCGAKMTEYDDDAWYTCPSCGNAIRRNEDGSFTWQSEIFNNKSNTNKKCVNCQESLSDSPYTAPWEDGNNSDGYFKCSNCGYINFQWED